MRDQAERLRELAKRSLESKSPRSQTRVIAVASGKGGVGKTNFTVNFALALQEEGKRAVIFDADLGMANIDVVLGIVPTFNLTHVIRGQKTLQEIMVEGPNGLKILPGSSGVEDLVQLSELQIQNLVKDWSNLEEDFDYILVDMGAGIHSDVLNFLRAADDIVVILTPEPPSITDAYSLIKVLVQKGVTNTLKLVVNQATDAEEGHQIYRRVSKVANEFLKADLEMLGIVPRDDKVSASVKRQRPFILEYPNTEASRGIRNTVKNLLQLAPEKTDDGGMKGFLTKMIGFFKRSRGDGDE